MAQTVDLGSRHWHATKADGVLRVESGGVDPQLGIPLAPVAGPVTLHWRMRSQAQGPVDLLHELERFAEPEAEHHGHQREGVP